MIYKLELKAILNGCNDLQLEGGFDDPRHKYTFRCQACRNTATIRAIQGHGTPHGAENGGKPTAATEMIRFEFHGATPVKSSYVFGGGWEMKSNGNIFRDLNLSSCPILFHPEHYDANSEEVGMPGGMVSIGKCKAEFKLVK